jgi:hypothetical protein
MSLIWIDGKCKKCGYDIIEMPSKETKYYDNNGNWINKEECIEANSNDYMNICSNPNCEEHKWHYVGDLEFLDYYEHKSKME